MVMRLVVGIGGLALLIPALLWGGPLAVEIIVAIAALICVDEYARMAFPDDRAVATPWLVVGLAAIWVAWLGFEQAGAVVPLVVAATFLLVLFRPGADLDTAARSLGRYAVGLAWISLLATLILLRHADHGLAWIFVVLTISWAGDTGAYFAGRFLGRRKLYPRISPKKTWEGVWGGVVAAIIGMFVVRAIGFGALTPLDCVLLGGIGCLVGVAGDLCESLLKRAYDVKDSGWIVPGHGGLLDRIDSVLFVAPTMYAYAVLVKGWAS